MRIAFLADVHSNLEALTACLADAESRRPGARLACLTVLKTSRIGMDIHVDAEGRNLHVRRLVELKHWARSLEIPGEKVTYHVLEAPDPGDAIVEFASANHVDHIMISSRGASTFRRYLGSVSSQVVARATCTVTVVKTAEERAASEEGAEADAGLMSL